MFGRASTLAAGLIPAISAAIAFTLAIFVTGYAAQARIITFDPRGSLTTYPVAINASKWITGYYEDGKGFHGFLRAPDGTITTIDVPGAGCTNILSINRSAEVVGIAVDDNSCNGSGSGFMRMPDGTITTFDVPGAVQTFAASINNAGIIAGGYLDGSNTEHGFLRRTDGSFTTFDPPGSTGTFDVCMNNTGVIAGSYDDSRGVLHGFVRATNGTFTTVDAPNSTVTQVNGISDSGEIVGYDYQHATAFVRMADGTIVTIQNPDGHGRLIDAYGINNDGKVTGLLYDPHLFVEHGFVRTSDGSITTFDPPGSVFTWSQAINSKGAITGSFAITEGDRYHGFLRTP